jgi:glucokinase
MGDASVIGVDLGGTKALAGLLDRDQRVIRRARREAAELEQRALLDAVVAVVEEVRAGVDPEPQAVGFGIPCLIDQREGKAVMAVNLPISDLPFRDIMAERLGLPVFVDNDANVAALAEHRYGAARGTQHAVVLTVGTGVGGGLILDGEPYRGAIGSGAELGHTVIDFNGPRCQGNCPNRGCLEVMASGTALGREGRARAEADPGSTLGRVAASGREITGALITELAHDGDEQCRDLLAEIGRNLGVGLANFVNVFNPEVLVIGGGVVAAGDMLLEPARAEMTARALSPSKELARVVPAHFGNDAGMIGAAALAFDGLARRAAA